MRHSATFSGNVCSNVTLRSTAGGAVANFRIAVNEGWKDQRTGEWRETTLYLQVSCWRRLAEHVAGSVRLGQPVIVHGRLQERTYDDRDGVSRTVVEVVADAVGHDLAHGTAVFERARRGPQTSEVAADAAVEPAAAAPAAGVPQPAGAAA